MEDYKASHVFISQRQRDCVKDQLEIKFLLNDLKGYKGYLLKKRKENYNDRDVIDKLTEIRKIEQAISNQPKKSQRAHLYDYDTIFRLKELKTLFFSIPALRYRRKAIDQGEINQSNEAFNDIKTRYQTIIQKKSDPPSDDLIQSSPEIKPR